jgi:hypothetical protein
MEKCSLLTVIVEIQIKPQMRNHFWLVNAGKDF